MPAAGLPDYLGVDSDRRRQILDRTIFAVGERIHPGMCPDDGLKQLLVSHIGVVVGRDMSAAEF
jgi:hypothetical protein